MGYWAEKQRRALYDFDEESFALTFPPNAWWKACSISSNGSMGFR